MTGNKVSSTGVVVNQGLDWQPMRTALIGCKLQLLTPGGVAVYGSISERSRKEYLGWQSLPKRPPWLIELMSPTRNDPTNTP